VTIVDRILQNADTANGSRSEVAFASDDGNAGESYQRIPARLRPSIKSGWTFLPSRQ